MIPWTEKKIKSWQTDYSRRKEINVEKDNKAEKSVIAFYKELIALRRTEKALTLGEYRLKQICDDFYVFERQYEEDKITIYASFEKGVCFPAFGEGKVLLDNYKNNASKIQPYRLVAIKG